MRIQEHRPPARTSPTGQPAPGSIAARGSTSGASETACCRMRPTTSGYRSRASRSDASSQARKSSGERSIASATARREASTLPAACSIVARRSHGAGAQGSTAAADLAAPARPRRAGPGRVHRRWHRAGRSRRRGRLPAQIAGIAKVTATSASAGAGTRPRPVEPRRDRAGSPPARRRATACRARPRRPGPAT